MSINVYESCEIKTTGNFLTRSIKDNLKAGKFVVYIDTTDGFTKHKINEHLHENITVVCTDDLKMICMLLQDILERVNGKLEIVVYIDHFENTQADIEDPTIQNRSTTLYRKKLFNLLNQSGVDAYITSIILPSITKTRTVSVSNYGECNYVQLSNFEKPLINKRT